MFRKYIFLFHLRVLKFETNRLFSLYIRYYDFSPCNVRWSLFILGAWKEMNIFDMYDVFWVSVFMRRFIQWFAPTECWATIYYSLFFCKQAMTFFVQKACVSRWTLGCVYFYWGAILNFHNVNVRLLVVWFQKRTSLQGAQIVFIPSAFTVPTGAAHWEVLCRARAVENQCFVVGPCQVGEHESGYAEYECCVRIWLSYLTLPHRTGPFLDMNVFQFPIVIQSLATRHTVAP